MISPIVLYKEFPRRYLIDSKEVFYSKETLTNAHIEIDDKDTEILKTMSKNSRIPIIAIAQKLKVDSKTIIYRIKKLESQNLITG